MTDDLGSALREVPFRRHVAEVALLGDGKDGLLRVTLPDGRTFGMELICSRMNVSVCSGVVVSTAGQGERALAVRILPAPGWEMAVARFRVDYPGSDDDWEQDCADWKRMATAHRPDMGRWAVNRAHIELVAWVPRSNVPIRLPGGDTAFLRSALAMGP